MIPPNFIRSVARRFEDGAKKYSAHNWKKGIPLSRYIDAIERHKLQLWEGDTSEDHVGAIGWNAAAYQWTLEHTTSGLLPKSLDDRHFVPGWVHPDNKSTTVGRPE